MARTQKEATTRAISHYFHRYRHVSTELRGKDLKALGISPGRIYRTILDELLDVRLNGEIKNRQEEEAFLKRRYPEVFEESQSGVIVPRTSPPVVDVDTCEGAKN